MVFRFRNNIHHQTEFLFPAMEAILSLELQGVRVHTVLVEMKLLAWSRDLLRLGRPDLDIVKLNTSSNVSLLNPAFATFSNYTKLCGNPYQLPQSHKIESSCSKYFQREESYAYLRTQAEAKCGIRIPRRCDGAGSPVRIGILNRHKTRQISNMTNLVDGLAAHYPLADIVVRYTYDNATLCQQVAWFAGLDVMIVAHGQSETNAVFLPHGAVMIEVVPWSMPGYCTYIATLHGSGVSVRQIVSDRLRGEVFPGLRKGEYERRECMENSDCRVWHRDKYNLVVSPAQVVEAIRSAGGLRKVCAAEAGPRGVRRGPRPPLRPGVRMRSRNGTPGASQQQQQQQQQGTAQPLATLGWSEQQNHDPVAAAGVPTPLRALSPPWVSPWWLRDAPVFAQRQQPGAPLAAAGAGAAASAAAAPPTVPADKKPQRSR